jgi:hypothetical protein
MVPPDSIPPSPDIQLTLGYRFVARAAPTFGGEPSEPPPGEVALENVVQLSPQMSWLAVQAEDDSLTFDPGVPDPVTGYPVAPFVAFLDDLLAGLVDPGIDYTCELYLMNHVLKEGRWVDGGGHLFKLLADGGPLLQEARIAGADYDAEILISVEVIP